MLLGRLLLVLLHIAAWTYLAAPAMQAQLPAWMVPTPPMGWNSWDAYGLTITETQFRDNAAVLRAKLLPFGWRYAVIDEGWYFENPEDRPTPEKLRYALDRFGRYVPVPQRFPSAATGLRPTALQVRPDAAATAGADALVEDAGARQHWTIPATVEPTSFTELGRWVHGQGLLFGIHIVRGIPRASVERNLPIEMAVGASGSFHARDAADTGDACPWDPTNWGVRDNAAGQAWYDSLLRQYATWGVDLLKVDCIADHPYKADEIRMIRLAIRRAATITGRQIVLSLSPGPTALEHAKELTGLANMWRISDDEWDIWRSDGKFPQGVADQFARAAAWASWAHPPNWPDADMLPWGELRPAPGWGEPRRSRLSFDEEKTQMTLWAMARSPLILGANLTLLDGPTLRLLTNPEVLALDQTSTGSFEARHEGDFIAWRSHLPDGREALALFNTGEQPRTEHREFREIDRELGAREWKVRDVWQQSDLGGGGDSSFSVEIPAHGCVLLLLR